MEEIGTYDAGEKKSLEEFLNSPEMEKLRQEMEESRKEYEKDTESFWNNLSYEDQLKAFYYVTSKIYQGDVVDDGSYRWVLYDVFNFDAEAYSLMMDSGYLAIHNLIADGMEYQKIKAEEGLTFSEDGGTIESGLEGF